MGCDAAITADRLDPQYINGPYLNLLGRASFIAENCQQAIEAHERNNDRGGPLGITVLARLAASYALIGRMEEAHRTIGRLLDYSPGFSLAHLTLFPIINFSGL